MAADLSAMKHQLIAEALGIMSHMPSADSPAAPLQLLASIKKVLWSLDTESVRCYK